MTGESFIDVDFCQRAKAGQVVAGDVFLSRKIKEEGRIISILSDGLGSGVKAGVLATLVPQVEKFLVLRGFWDGQHLLARLACWQMNDAEQEESIGFSIMTSIPFDVEYIYRVRAPKEGKQTHIEVWEARHGSRSKLLQDLEVKTPVSRY